jgi:hypothetical protein
MVLISIRRRKDGVCAISREVRILQSAVDSAIISELFVILEYSRLAAENKRVQFISQNESSRSWSNLSEQREHCVWVLIFQK